MGSKESNQTNKLENYCDSFRYPIFYDGWGSFVLFHLQKVYCVKSLESPQWGDSNDYTQNTSSLWKIEINRFLLISPDLVV